MNYIGLKMKKITKLIVSILGFVFLLTNASLAEKKFVPIISDDLISFVSFYTSTNNLAIPPITDENGYKELALQCEEDITYFIMSYHTYFDNVPLTASNGNIVIDKTGVADDGYTGYIKGHIEGDETVSLTGKVYHDTQFYGETIKTCNRSSFTVKNNLKVPTFNGNSQGKLVIQCERDVVFYIMAYDCLRGDTNPWVTTDNGTPITDEKKHVGEVFYVKGHVERKNSKSVTITGHVYSGGEELYIWPAWKQTCP